MLTLDASGVVSGTVTSGGWRNVVPISTGRYDAESRRLRLEGEAVSPGRSTAVPFVIEGSIGAGPRLKVGFQFGDVRGSATFVRPSVSLTIRRRLRASRRRLEQRLEPVAIPIARYLRGLRRPSAASNTRGLQARGETVASFHFRDATSADIPALARLHVKTWAATYPGVRHPPTFEIRESQWIEAFQNIDGNWFAIVIEKPNGELVGFAKGVRHENGVGDLNKIYLLTEYQRLGLGRRLVGHVARRFLAMGQSSMSLSADAANPSCHFYHALGAENPREPDGRVHRGAFVWPDLEALAARCPIDS